MSTLPMALYRSTNISSVISVPYYCFHCNRCTFILGDDGQPVQLSVQYQQALRGQVLNLMDSYGLRSIGIAYREFPAGTFYVIAKFV